MLSRIGFERRDGRNLVLATVTMTVLLFFYAEGPTADRAIAALVGGLFSAIVFLVVTAAIYNRYPEYR